MSTSKDNTNVEILVKNDAEWRRHLIKMQDKTFDKIDEIKKDFSKKQISCEKRFTKLETKAIVFGTIGGTVITLSVWIGKMIYNGFN